jgi:DNA-binding winged helix-turn-helix (wHTH) protein
MNTVADQPVFEFAGFRLDAAQRRLYGPDGQPITLAARAFDTLHYLLEHPGVLLDKNTIMQAVWPNVIVAENNLNQAISALRHALGEGHIATIPGRGYQFVTPVTRPTTPASPEAVPPPDTATSDTSSRRTPGSSVNNSLLDSGIMELKNLPTPVHALKVRRPEHGAAVPTEQTTQSLPKSRPAITQLIGRKLNLLIAGLFIGVVLAKLLSGLSVGMMPGTKLRMKFKPGFSQLIKKMFEMYWRIALLK